MVKKAADYIPFYPTTLGTKLHDITLHQLPAYSILRKPEVKDKFYSPGPGAYPKDDGKKGYQIPKSLYPADNAFRYTMGVKGKETAKYQTPSPAAYPLEKNRNRNAKDEVLSIYPKGNANKFSIGLPREQKQLPLSPGPAILPRDTDTKNNINSLFPKEKANKFTIPRRRIEKDVTISPGPARYPCVKEQAKNKITSIYPAETQLLPTMKTLHDIKDHQRKPAPNAYPILDVNVNTKTRKADLTKKMIIGKRTPLYSFGIKHSPKQRILVVKDDEY